MDMQLRHVVEKSVPNVTIDNIGSAATHCLEIRKESFSSFIDIHIQWGHRETPSEYPRDTK